MFGFDVHTGRVQFEKMAPDAEPWRSTPAAGPRSVLRSQVMGAGGEGGGGGGSPNQP